MISKGKGSKSTHRGRNLWSRGKWWFIAVGAVGALTLLIVLSTTLSGEKVSEPGIAAPDLDLNTATGTIRLSELEGQPLLLYFSYPG